jgi:hypothetical protein
VLSAATGSFADTGIGWNRGWYVGGGLEYAVKNYLNVGIQYTHVDAKRHGGPTKPIRGDDVRWAITSTWLWCARASPSSGSKNNFQLMQLSSLGLRPGVFAFWGFAMQQARINCLRETAEYRGREFSSAECYD